MTWLIVAMMAVTVLGVLLRPLMRPAQSVPDRQAHDRGLYRSELAEVERLRAAGLLEGEDARSLTIELKRRALRIRAGEASAPAAGKSGWAVACLGVGLAAGLAAYAALGNPGLPEAPAPEFEVPAGAEAEYAAARAAVAKNPGDFGQWMQLAGSLVGAGKSAEAVGFIGGALDIIKSSPELWTVQAYTLLAHADGQMTPAAQYAFNKALSIDPKHPMARFYYGLAWMQQGKPDEALAIWRELEADTPQDAPWLPFLKERMATAGRMQAALAAQAAADAAQAR